MLSPFEQNCIRFLPADSPDDLVFDPHSNTGSNSQLGTTRQGTVEARIDNLTLLWVKNLSQDLDGAIWRFLGVEFDRVNHIPRKIGVWWDKCFSSNTGALLCEREGALGVIHCRLSISGEDCARVGNGRLRGFMLWAYRNLRQLRCSRIDLAVDDFAKHLQLNQIEQEISDGNYSGFKKAKVIENFGESHNGWSVYMGSRSGEKMVRAYNKCAESKGLIDSHRWEVEYKGETADAVYRMVLEFPEEQADYQRSIINLATSAVSFVEKLDKNISRNTLVEWWHDWLEYLKACPIKPKINRVKTSIAKKKEWIRRAVSKSLAMVQDVLEVADFTNFLNEIIDDARFRYQPIDEILMRDYRRYRHRLDEQGIMIDNSSLP
jgi:hypothetical protein